MVAVPWTLKFSFLTLAVIGPVVLFLLQWVLLRSGIDTRVSTPSNLGFDLLNITIGELEERLDNATLSSVELVRAYIERIEADNFAGLELRAVNEIAPYDQVLKIAHQLDVERSKGFKRGRLHGIPILVKDNIATDPELGMNTTAGSLALVGAIVPGDAPVIANLRKTGAIILAKASLSEWSDFRGGFKGGHSWGWSAIAGQCSSAYVKGASPGTSSSGTGVGVSAGFAAAGLGTDTAGSILLPANRASLYGLRPTLGLVSTVGVVPISFDQDTVGPMAKSVGDLAILFQGMLNDELDFSNQSPPKLGIPRQVLIESPRIAAHIRAHFNSTLQSLSKRGWTLVDPVDVARAEEIVQMDPNEHLDVLTESFREDLEGYLQTLIEVPTGVRTLEDVINFNDQHSAEEFPPGQCCQQTFISALKATGRDSESYRVASSRVRAAAKEALEGTLDAHGLDAILLPTEPFARLIPAYGGYPAGQMPLGFDAEGNPYGVTLIGRKGSDARLITIMRQWESEQPIRRVPERLRSKWNTG